MPDPGAGRRRRLAEELEESGLRGEGPEDFRAMLIEEIDHALRPEVHERRVASSGTVLEPHADPATWATGAQLDITRGPVTRQPLSAIRRFTDGLSSWLVRRTDGTNEWMVFDRPAGSERDLVVLGRASAGTTSHPLAVGSKVPPRAQPMATSPCSRPC
jgi:hypothetical protein